MLICVCDLICDKRPLLSKHWSLVCEKEPLTKHLKNTFVCIVTMNSCIYIVTICIQNVFGGVLTVVPFLLLQTCDKCFDRLYSIEGHLQPNLLECINEIIP